MKALWDGSLSFGLINIPVSLYSASLERTLNFKLIDKHGNCPISYKRVCRSDGKEVPYDDIVKGYEYKKGDFVVLDEKDFKMAEPKKNDLIEILQFTDLENIDTKYFEKPYYIEPNKKSGKAYALLAAALGKSRKVGIAKFIMREQEHIAAIKEEGGILILNQLRFEDEIRKPEIKIPHTDYSEGELDMANSLIKKLTRKFDPKKFKDTHTEKLEKIIKEKARGKTIHVKESAKPKVDTDMKDLIKMLKKSLDEKAPHLAKDEA